MKKKISYKLFNEIHSFYFERCELHKSSALKSLYYSARWNRGEPMSRREVFALINKQAYPVIYSLYGGAE